MYFCVTLVSRGYSRLVKTIVVSTLQTFNFKLIFIVFLVSRYWTCYVMYICIIYDLPIIQNLCYIVYSLDKFKNIKGSVFDLLANYIIHTKTTHSCTTNLPFIQTVPFIHYKHNFYTSCLHFIKPVCLYTKTVYTNFTYLDNIIVYIIFSKFISGHFLLNELKCLFDTSIVNELDQIDCLKGKK